MVDAAKINNDRSWFNRTLTLLSTDFSLVASKNLPKYNLVFLKSKEYIASHLRVQLREFSTGPDAEYIRHMRLMFHAVHDMVDCIATAEQIPPHQLQILATVGQLGDELKTLEGINQIKTYYNQLISFLENFHEVQQRSA